MIDGICPIEQLLAVDLHRQVFRYIKCLADGKVFFLQYFQVLLQFLPYILLLACFGKDIICVPIWIKGIHILAGTVALEVCLFQQVFQNSFKGAELGIRSKKELAGHFLITSVIDKGSVAAHRIIHCHGSILKIVDVGCDFFISPVCEHRMTLFHHTFEEGFHGIEIWPFICPAIHI